MRQGVTGLVCLLGEQLWWDLDALAQWGSELQDVVLVGTPQHWSSGAAGERTAAFIRRNFPHITVGTTSVATESPEDVDAAVRAIVSSSHHSWIVSGAGGTRLMFAGAMRAAHSSDRAVFVYRDQQTEWQAIDIDGVSRGLPGLDPHAMERFSAADLLSVTWASDTLSVKSRPANIHPAIHDAAERVVAGEQWLQIFENAVTAVRRSQSTRKSQSGFLFEEFVVSILRKLGVEADDVLVGATLGNATSKLQEVDVVVNHRGRLYLIDCKLTTNGRRGSFPVIPIGSQIREAESTRFHLGDGGVRLMILRPNWELNGTFRNLVETLGMEVVDGSDLDRDGLLNALVKFLGMATF